MKRIIIILGMLLASSYVAFCIYSINKIITNEKHIEVKLQTLDSQLDELESRYELVNDELNRSNSDKEQLLKEKDELDKKRIELEHQLQARKENKNKIAKTSENVVNIVTNTQNVGATAGNSGCSYYLEQAGITNPAALRIINKENRGCNPCVYNDGSPTGSIDCNYKGGNAYGIPQSLPGNKMASHGDDWRTNPVTQLRWMQDYVYGRYGSWEAAEAHHTAMNWY